MTMTSYPPLSLPLIDADLLIILTDIDALLPLIHALFLLLVFPFDVIDKNKNVCWKY